MTDRSENILTQEQRNAAARRIRALLAKTTENGCTEDEAMQAMDMACKLRDKYRIDFELAESYEEVDEHTVRPKFIWHFEFYKRVSPAIAMYLGIRAFSKNDPKRKSGEITLFVGTETELDFACWLLQALADYAVSGAAQLRGALARKSFLIGVAARIVQRLHEMYKQREQSLVAGDTRNAIVLHSAAGRINTYLAKKYPRIHTARKRAITIDRDSYNAGRAHGDNASFSRPVTGAAAVKAIR